MRPDETNTDDPGIPDRLKIGEVVAFVGVSRATIYRMVDSGDFPKPVNLSPRRVVWLGSEVRAWWERKIEGREQ